MRNKIVIISLLGAFTASVAWAQGNSWGSYEPAFPKFPCQDGWMGCIQDGRRVDPALGVDGKGMPTSSDMRVGWFDLEPTSNFSPFVSLSKYTGETPLTIGGPAVAGGANPGANDGTAEVDFFDPDAERARKAAETTRLAEAEAQKSEERAREEAERARREEAKAQRQADEQAQAATRAMAAANAASDSAEKARLQVDAQRQREEADRAKAQAREAAKLREEREEREAEQSRRAADAAAAATVAEEDRRQKEAVEAREAESRREAEVARQEASAAEQQRAADAARAKAQQEAAVAQEEAERRALDAVAAAAAAQDVAEKSRLEAAAREAEQDQERAASEAEAKADADAAKAAEAARVKGENEAREAKAADQKRLEEERKRIDDEEKQRRLDASGEGGDVQLEGDCSDLVKLETVAILGKLDPTQTSCLEQNLDASTRQTRKSKISRMLMVNAFSGGETQEWETLMKRHLQEIEQSDPDLCYKYSLHLSKKGVGSQFEVIKWANVALENRTVWTGNTYTQRVYSLFKIRAAASQKLWQNRENKHAASPTEETNQKAKDARNQTKEYAREWYEYAKVAGKDVTTALNLCMMAAGTKDYCEAG